MRHNAFLSTIAAATVTLSACSSQGAAPSALALQTQPHSVQGERFAAGQTGAPGLYILNRELPKAAGYVNIYSGAGARFSRKFGVIKNETFHNEDYADMTADASGHLYLYPATKRGVLQVYQNYGQHLLQTIEFHKTVFGNLTLDAAGNLFVGDGGRLFEFAPTTDGSLAPTPSRRLKVISYWVATDPSGDVGASSGINGFSAFAPKSKKPFWTLHASGIEYLNIAFDQANNLYAVQSPATNGDIAVDVYARGATTPSYTITNGAYAPGQLALDGSGNLYVLNACAYNCGTIKNSISIYAPGATVPTTVLEPPANTTFSNMAVSKTGYLAIIENETYDSGGPVVVYAPGATTPSITISNGLQRPGQLAFGD